jgi:hypothetical protein
VRDAATAARQTEAPIAASASAPAPIQPTTPAVPLIDPNSLAADVVKPSTQYATSLQLYDRAVKRTEVVQIQMELAEQVLTAAASARDALRDALTKLLALPLVPLR